MTYTRKELTCSSISGGKTSAYMAIHYPTDYNVFALITINDSKNAPKDKKLVQKVSDKIGKDFIATAEDDTILYTILDLEQKLGAPIDWVAGLSFDEVIKKRGGYLPNKIARYCTTEMKLKPLFEWWRKKQIEPILMNIGFRANEQRRAKTMKSKLNENGLLEFKHIYKRENDRNKWTLTEWQKPNFPLIDNAIFKDVISEFWKGNTVRFAALNNCIGCFHRSPLLLKTMQLANPTKFDWFINQETPNANWRSDVSYLDIKNYKPQNTFDFNDFSDCDSGYCTD